MSTKIPSSTYIANICGLKQNLNLKKKEGFWTDRRVQIAKTVGKIALITFVATSVIVGTLACLMFIPGAPLVGLGLVILAAVGGKITAIAVKILLLTAFVAVPTATSAIVATLAYPDASPPGSLGADSPVTLPSNIFTESSLKDSENNGAKISIPHGFLEGVRENFEDFEKVSDEKARYKTFYEALMAMKAAMGAITLDANRFPAPLLIEGQPMNQLTDTGTFSNPINIQHCKDALNGLVDIKKKYEDASDLNKLNKKMSETDLNKKISEDLDVILEVLSQTGQTLINNLAGTVLKPLLHSSSLAPKKTEATRIEVSKTEDEKIKVNYFLETTLMNNNNLADLCTKLFEWQMSIAFSHDGEKWTCVLEDVSSYSSEGRINAPQEPNISSTNGTNTPTTTSGTLSTSEEDNNSPSTTSTEEAAKLGALLQPEVRRQLELDGR